MKGATSRKSLDPGHRPGSPQTHLRAGAAGWSCRDPLTHLALLQLQAEKSRGENVTPQGTSCFNRNTHTLHRFESRQDLPS